MSEDTKKAEPIERDAKPTELSEQALDQVAGGRAIGANGVGKVAESVAPTVGVPLPGKAGPNGKRF